MKKLAFSLLAIAAFASSAVAGTVMYAPPSKEYKAPVEYVEVGCFLDQELQIDIFGSWADGNGPTHAGPIREHGWGGGIGINYFFARNIGIGVDGYWLAAKENYAVDQGEARTAFHNVTGSLIFRFPIDEICLAPYLFVGGGFHVDGEQWASAHAGLGLEYRIVPNKVGIFTDARYTYFGDRYGNGDQGNVMVKAGIRFVF